MAIKEKKLKIDIYFYVQVYQNVSVQQAKQKYLNETWSTIYYYVRNATTTFYLKECIHLEARHIVH